MFGKIEIIVDGEPKGKGRPRVSFGRLIPDQKTEAEEVHIRGIGSKVMAGRPPSINPIRMVLEAVFDMPISWPARLRESPQLAHISKPDLDNIEKLYLDALNGVVYVDDAQVCEVIKRKRYGEGQRVHVIFEEIVTVSDHPALRRSAKRQAEEKVNPRGKRHKPRRTVKPAVKDAPIGKRIR